MPRSLTCGCPSACQLDLRHAAQTNESDLDTVVQYGVDLHDYYLSVEWDLMQVPAQRHNVFYYSCCKESRYIDISFNITMRRKTVFYTVNLIIPCVGISCLTILVFYLPSESGEKVTLCVSVLLSLTVFFLLLAEIIPPTSLAVPLLGKYLLFTMVLVTLSVMSTICVLNIGFRSPSTHRLSARTRRVFLEWLPPLLLIRRPRRPPEDPLDQLRPPEDPLDQLRPAGWDAPLQLDATESGLLPLTAHASEHHLLCPALPAHLPTEPGACRPPQDSSWPATSSRSSPSPLRLGAGPSSAGPTTPSATGPRTLSASSLDSLPGAGGWSTPRHVPEIVTQQQHVQDTLRGVHTIASRFSNLDAFEEVRKQNCHLSFLGRYVLTRSPGARNDRLSYSHSVPACAGGA